MANVTQECVAVGLPADQQALADHYIVFMAYNRAMYGSRCGELKPEEVERRYLAFIESCRQAVIEYERTHS